MKQKIVIKVAMYDAKRRSKAMTIAVGLPGVHSVTITGEAKDHLQVIGDDVDSADLVELLRKKVGHADFATVDEVKKEETPPKEETSTSQPVDEGCCHSLPSSVDGGFPDWHYVEVRESNPACIIM